MSFPGLSISWQKSLSSKSEFLNLGPTNLELPNGDGELNRGALGTKPQKQAKTAFSLVCQGFSNVLLPRNAALLR